MKKIKIDRKSIVFRVTSLIIVLVIAQAVLLTAFLIIGGVLSQAEKNSYISFSDKVKNRKDYIQREMKNRWTNMDPYLGQISAQLSEYEDADLLFDLISDKLIALMRTTQASGAFIILGQDNTDMDYPSLYLRDYDPVLNDYGNKDLYMIFGPSALANKLKIPLDQMWKNKLSMKGMDTSFFHEPYDKAFLTNQSSLLGYWSLPFRLFKEDISIITYTMPLFDKNNKVRGVIGVEIATQYLNQFLPSTDLQAKDSLGYFIGFKNENDENIKPILLTKEIQKRMLNTEKELSYRRVSPEENIYILQNHKDIYVAIEEMNLYNNNTPFQDDQWYLVGMMSSNHLLSYVYRIQKTLLFSVMLSIFIGITSGYLVSYRFTKPIMILAKRVRESDKDKKIILQKTGLTEVDELSKAMQMASNSLLESTVKMSRIIDLVGLPIGAFEYREGKNSVFVTDQLQHILFIDEEEMTKIVHNKQLFIEKINVLLRNPDEDEENVYILYGDPIRWVKMKNVNNDKITIGVIIDVTEEMIEKKKIIRDRDYDHLTGIYNRKALQRRGEEILVSREVSLTTAILMFDLDNLKIINDTYGHKWGDLYINLAVKHLEQISEDQKILGRRSGDEFALVLYNFNSKEEIRSSIEKFYMNLDKDVLKLPDGNEKVVAISAGIVWAENYDLTYEEFLQYADDALYKAKKNKKGSFCEIEL